MGKDGHGLARKGRLGMAKRGRVWAGQARRGRQLWRHDMWKWIVVIGFPGERFVSALRTGDNVQCLEATIEDSEGLALVWYRPLRFLPRVFVFSEKQPCRDWRKDVLAG